MSAVMSEAVGGDYRHWQPFDSSADEETHRRLSRLVMEATRGMSAIQSQLDQALARSMRLADVIDLALNPARALGGVDLSTLERARGAIEELAQLGVESVADLTEMNSRPAHVPLPQLRDQLAEIDARLAPLLKFAHAKGGRK